MRHPCKCRTLLGRRGRLGADRPQFAAFAKAGFGKIAGNFLLRRYGVDRTLVTYESDARDRRDCLPGLYALLAPIGAIHGARDALTAMGDRGGGQRPLGRWIDDVYRRKALHVRPNCDPLARLT